MAVTYCARCGYQVTRSTRIKSKFTGYLYCADLMECDRRALGKLTYEEIAMYANKYTEELKNA